MGARGRGDGRGRRLPAGGLRAAAPHLGDAARRPRRTSRGSAQTPIRVAPMTTPSVRLASRGPVARHPLLGRRRPPRIRPDRAWGCDPGAGHDQGARTSILVLRVHAAHRCGPQHRRLRAVAVPGRTRPRPRRLPADSAGVHDRVRPRGTGRVGGHQDADRLPRRGGAHRPAGAGADRRRRLALNLGAVTGGSSPG